MTATPAYVRNARLDILAANQRGAALFALAQIRTPYTAAEVKEIGYQAVPYAGIAGTERVQRLSPSAAVHRLPPKPRRPRPR